MNDVLKTYQRSTDYPHLRGDRRYIWGVLVLLAAFLSLVVKVIL